MATLAQQDKRLTVEEFLALPDDGIAYELVDGYRVPLYTDQDGTPMTGATGRHSFVSARLLVAIARHVDAHALGAVFGEQLGVVLRGDRYKLRAPDVTYASWDRLPNGIPAERLTTAPDLVAEVLSPNDRASEVQRKIHEYLDAGVRLVWVADPENRTVTAYTPDGLARIHGADATLDGGDVLPELRIPVGPLFAFDRPAPTTA